MRTFPKYTSGFLLKCNAFGGLSGTKTAVCVGRISPALFIVRAHFRWNPFKNFSDRRAPSLFIEKTKENNTQTSCKKYEFVVKYQS